MRDEIDSPLGALKEKLGTFATRASDALAALALPPFSRPEVGSAPSEVLDWAIELDRTAERVSKSCKDAIAALEEKIRASKQIRSSALTEVRVPDEPSLEEGIIRAESDAQLAEQDLRRARDERPKAAALDASLAEARGLVEALEELRRLLSDSRFIHYVVTRRQRALLASASELLRSMTGDRYGFSEGFDVVDRLSGVPRSPKTLSGGETFLASLSLALGLVELAGRSGGRLEALFLDEGFGALDASSLSEALGALERQAEGGRLVAVITHLRAVAEGIERVLWVRREPTGSVARWMTGAERDTLAMHDVEEALLS